MEQIKNLDLDKKIGLSLLVLFLVILFSFKHSSRDLITANVLVGNLPMQDETYADAKNILVSHYNTVLKQPLTFTHNGITKEISPFKLGFYFDSKATIDKLEDISGDSLIAHWGQRLTNLFIQSEITPEITANNSTFKLKFQEHFPSLSGAKDAMVQVDGKSNITVRPHASGQTPDFLELKKSIINAINENSPQPIEIVTHHSEPTYLTAQAQKDAAKLKSILHKSHTFRYEERVENIYTHKFFIQPYMVKVKNNEIMIDEDHLTKYIKTNIAPEIERETTNLTIKALPDQDSIYAKSEGYAKDGITIDYKSALFNFRESIINGKETTDFTVKTSPSKVINETGVDLGPLTLISQGRSGFAHSALGRKHNIRKGIKDRMHNILLAPGEEYSFNANLGVINRANGWEQSLAIFGGEELVPVPGGGLCQVSTTLFRALAGAGLEVLEKSNHTLYVLYYEEYGNGLDAAIYPGSKDLKFRNDTQNYLFVQAYTDGDEAFVELYGEPKHKSVELIGPIYSGRVPPEYLKLTDPNWNEISWIQKVTKTNGEVEENVIMSRYNSKPRKLYPYVERDDQQ